MRERWKETKSERWYKAVSAANRKRRGTKNAFSQSRSDKMKKCWRDPDYRRRVKEASAATYATEEYHKKRSRLSKRIMASPESRMRQSKLNSRLWKDPKYRKKQKQSGGFGNSETASRTAKVTWANPKTRKRLLAARKVQGKPLARRVAMSNSIQNLWQDPAWRKKVLRARAKSKKYQNRGKKISEGMKRSYAAGNYTIWNAGQTKHTHPSVMKISQALKGRIPDYNKYRQWYHGPNGDIRMRSQWEVDFALFCDKFNLAWQYEPKHFHIGDGEWAGTTFTPDFYLPNAGLYVELKGRATDEFWCKMVEFHKLYPKKRILLYERDKMDVIQGALKAA